MANKFYSILSILIAIILLLSIWVTTLLKNPKIETKFIEVQKEIIVEKEVLIEVEPTHAYNITSEEREMLARLLYLEANTESMECQQAIVSVVLNRLDSGYWGNSLKKVIYAQGQFSPAKYIHKTTPTENNYQAVDYVLKNGATIPKYVLYFRADYHFNWRNYCQYRKIDDVCFGYLERDYK